MRCVGGLGALLSSPTAAPTGLAEGPPCPRYALNPSAPPPAPRLHAQAAKQLRILHLLCRILHAPPRQPCAPVSAPPRCTRATPRMLPVTPSAAEATELPLEPGILLKPACWILHAERPIAAAQVGSCRAMGRTPSDLSHVFAAADANNQQLTRAIWEELAGEAVGTDKNALRRYKVWVAEAPGSALVGADTNRPVEPVVCSDRLRWSVVPRAASPCSWSTEMSLNYTARCAAPPPSPPFPSPHSSPH